MVDTRAEQLNARLQNAALEGPHGWAGEWRHRGRITMIDRDPIHRVGGAITAAELACYTVVETSVPPELADVLRICEAHRTAYATNLQSDAKRHHPQTWCPSCKSSS